MKTKLEAIANVTVIVVALAVGYVALAKYADSNHEPRSATVGDTLAKLPGLDWNKHRRTLVLALNTGCHYCEESVPFYQKLAQEQRQDGNDLEVVAVFANEAETVRQFTAREGLTIRSVASVSLDRLGVVATPTLILVNSEGRVERSWVGILTSRQEVDLLNLVSGS
jgi:thiol-disulfide isomerase/thioredoxin